MTNWVEIANKTIEPDAPLISSTMFALRDNPKAIAEGAAGAPPVEKEALADYPWGAEDFQAGTAERDWVLARTAAASAYAVGTYTTAHLVFFSYQNPGDTVPGTALQRNGTMETLLTSGSGNLPGTWRAMTGVRGAESEPQTISTTKYVGLFLRIS